MKKRGVGLLGQAAFITLYLSNFAQAAEPVAAPVLYPADLWQGREQSVIRVLNRMDSHLETMTIPVGGQGQYRSLHLTLQSCVERPETVPYDAAAKIVARDDSDPEAHFEGWILAKEPWLSEYKSPLYTISVISCSGNLTAPKLAPLPKPVLPELPAPPPNSTPASGSSGSSRSSSGPLQLAPLGESPPTPRPAPSSDSGGPTPLAPLSGDPSPAPLPPPQPYQQ